MAVGALPSCVIEALLDSAFDIRQYIVPNPNLFKIRHKSPLKLKINIKYRISMSYPTCLDPVREELTFTSMKGCGTFFTFIVAPFKPLSGFTTSLWRSSRAYAASEMNKIHKNHSTQSKVARDRKNKSALILSLSLRQLQI